MVDHSNVEYTLKKIFSTDCFFHVPGVILLPDGKRYRPHKRRAYLIYGSYSTSLESDIGFKGIPIEADGRIKTEKVIIYVPKN